MRLLGRSVGYGLKLLFFPIYLLGSFLLLIWGGIRIAGNEFFYRQFAHQLITYRDGKYLLRYNDDAGRFCFETTDAPDFESALQRALAENEYVRTKLESIFPRGTKILKAWWQIGNPVVYWNKGASEKPYKCT